MGVLVPADDRHDGGGGEDTAERPQVDPSGTRVASGSFAGGGGERPGDDGGQPGRGVYNQRRGEDQPCVRDGQAEDLAIERHGWPSRICNVTGFASAWRGARW